MTSCPRVRICTIACPACHCDSRLHVCAALSSIDGSRMEIAVLAHSSIALNVQSVRHAFRFAST